MNMTMNMTMPMKAMTFKKFNDIFLKVIMTVMTVMMFTVSVSATSETGTTASAITDVGSALTGILGYLGDVTSSLLGNDLWILGMGFFVISFVAGFVMYLFRVGRR